MDTGERFFRAYIEAALWSSSDDEGEPLDQNHSIDDVHEDSLREMRSDCDRFRAENTTDLESWEPEQAGHDFWLTRNGHGAGFWDREIGTEDERERLTAAAHAFGESDLWADENGVFLL